MRIHSFTLHFELEVWAIAAHGMSESYEFFWYLGSRFTSIYHAFHTIKHKWHFSAVGHVPLYC